MLAVLEDAIACFQKYIFARDGKGKMLFQEAEEWVQERGNDWLFSFANVCETLGFDPEYLKQGIMQWKEQKLAERTQTKIYRLSPQQKQNKRRVSRSGKFQHRMRKATGR